MSTNVARVHLNVVGTRIFHRNSNFFFIQPNAYASAILPDIILNNLEVVKIMSSQNIASVCGRAA